jgi:hypothetical protein
MKIAYMKNLIIALILLFISSSAISQNRYSKINSFDGKERITYSLSGWGLIASSVYFTTTILKGDTARFVTFSHLNIDRSYYMSNSHYKPTSFEIMTDDSIYRLPESTLALSSIGYTSNAVGRGIIYSCLIIIPLDKELFEVLKSCKGFRIDGIAEGRSWKNGADKYNKLIDLVSSYETFK